MSLKTHFAECAKAADFALREGNPLKEEAYRELRTIIDTANDGFLLMDAEGRLLDANQAYCSMSGYSRQELLAMNIRDLTSVDSGALVKERIEQAMRDGTLRFETLHRRKDGGINNLEASLTHPPDLGDRVFNFYRDITERKHAEEALRESEPESGLGTVWRTHRGKA